MGVAATPHRTSRHRRRLLFSTAPTEVLVDQADDLAADRRWRAAADVLAVAATTMTEPDRRPVLERLAVASADAGRHSISSEAVFSLQSMWPRTADTWVAFANVALARRNYRHADSSARSALAVDPDHRGAWAVLAASYAGLGWFDRAEECLARIDVDRLDDLERWRIGRAVNQWAVRNRAATVAAMMSTFLVGVLAVALWAAAPLATRRWRLRSLAGTQSTRRLAEWAVEAWRFERGRRLLHGAAVVGSVVAFMALIVL